jgi:hypothetical protein
MNRREIDSRRSLPELTDYCLHFRIACREELHLRSHLTVNRRLPWHEGSDRMSLQVHGEIACGKDSATRTGTFSDCVR